jgi:hypothetical protein
MLKKYFGTMLILLLNIFSILLIVLTYITQKAGIQLVAVQKIYWSLDTSWVMIRTVVMLLFLIGGSIVLYLCRKNAIMSRSFQWGLLMIIVGLVLGLSVFYGASCCDLPVSFLIGFPFSWLRGISDAQNRLPTPILQYLINNIGSIKWHLDYFCLFVDLLFWYNVGIVGYVVLKRKTVLL